jgi:putative transcriptional regulator
LENEMKTGSWILVPADPKWVFATDPALVWGELLRTLDEAYRPYADMPFDPSSN